jgi:hypothetical protein
VNARIDVAEFVITGQVTLLTVRGKILAALAETEKKTDEQTAGQESGKS